MVALGISLMPAAESVVCRSSTVAINVTSAADVQNITDVLACTGGGTFHITWYTSATILQTIEVSNKKEVTVNGVGVPSIRGVLANDNDEGTAIDTDVGSDAGIFSVSNGSTLRLNNLVLEGGNAEHGGAVNLFSSSSLYVVGCTFVNNSATNGAVSNEQANDNGLPPGDGACSLAAAAVIVDVNSAALEVRSTRTYNTSACVLRCIPELTEAVARHKILGRLVVPVEGLEELDGVFAPQDLTAEQ
eukprot:jgi/Undpi1/3039/HiC_scaffold_15.g06415.m1